MNFQQNENNNLFQEYRMTKKMNENQKILKKLQKRVSSVTQLIKKRVDANKPVPNFIYNRFEDAMFNMNEHLEQMTGVRDIAYMRPLNDGNFENFNDAIEQPDNAVIPAENNEVVQPEIQPLTLVKVKADEQITVLSLRNVEQHSDDYKKFHTVLFTDVLESALELIEYPMFKYQVITDCVFYKLNDNGDEDVHYVHFKNDLTSVLNREEFSNNPDAIEQMNNAVENFTQNGSGWIYKNTIKAVIKCIPYQPLNSGSYIAIPEEFQGRCINAGVINIKNEDNNCFEYSVISCLYPSDRQRKNSPLYYKQMLTKGLIDFSMFQGENKEQLKHMPKFEKVNKVAVYVHEITYEKNCKICPVYPSDYKKHYSLIRDEGYKCIDVLRIVDKDKSHFCSIKNIEALYHSQVSNYDGKIYFCRCCCSYQTSLPAHENHVRLCHKNESSNVLYAEQGEQVKFNANITKLKMAPYVMYADFESILEKCNTKKGDNTELFQKHKMCGWAIQGCSTIKPLNKIDIQHGSGQQFEMTFLEQIKQNVTAFHELSQTQRKFFSTKMTQEQKNKHNCATKCYVCDGAFESFKSCQQTKKYDNMKVHDHDHITGQYIGPAHSKCNIMDKINQNVYVLFHNMRGYDSHLLFKTFGKFYENVNDPNISVIANTSEKFMTITINFNFGVNQYVRVHFKDSLLYLNASLECLTQNLANVTDDKQTPDITKFNNLQKFVNKLNLPNRQKMTEELAKKQIYPYEFFDTVEKFENTEFPTREQFFTTLTCKECSIEDYKHAKNMYEQFNCKNLWDYHDLYLKTDVILLSDIIEDFRQMAYKDFQLDPIQYISLPSYTYDCFLKTSDEYIKSIGGIDCLSDPEMYLYIESAIRGGVSMISRRYAKANNEKCETYDETTEKSYIKYFDVVNLYGYAMTQKLPTNSFKWLDDVTNFNSKIYDDGEYGAFIEIDGYFPKETHDKMNDYPVLPESINPEVFNQKSEYNNQLLVKNNRNTKSVTNKLIPHLAIRQKYICHHKTLNQAISLGFVVVKVHRVLQFKQFAILKPYVDFLTEKRKLSTNEFQKNFYKLMINALYGKTIEDVRKHSDTKIIKNTSSKYNKWCNKATLTAIPKECDEFFTFSFKKQQTLLNKPIHIGCGILEIAKHTVFDFHYNYMFNKYGNKAKLLMTDTDSLVYHITTENWENDVMTDKQRFDLSNYSKKHQLYCDENKKRAGKMKDEFPEECIEQFVGLKAKMYALKFSDKHEKMTHKGVQKSAKTTQGYGMSFNDYKNVLENETELIVSQNNIRCYNHELYTIRSNKTGLSGCDDKRYLLDKYSSYSYGHYAITENK